MSELSPEDSEWMKNWHYATAKGRIASFVARGRENPSTISKALKTLMAKGELSGQDLNKILFEVEKESVQAKAFAENVSRKKRFESLSEELLR